MSKVLTNTVPPFSRGRYRAELEFFNITEGKKTIQEKVLESVEDLKPFRDGVTKSEEVGIICPSGVILTAVRIYKGNEIIYDKYSVNGELNVLLELFKQK